VIDVILGWAMWLGLVMLAAAVFLLVSEWQHDGMRDRRDETARWQAMRDGFERGER
jgi:hypothetical protein